MTYDYLRGKTFPMHALTDFKSWWQKLTDSEQERIAHAAVTTPGYVRTHLIYRRKRPSVDLMKRLEAACDGAFSYAQLLEFFYADPDRSDGA